MKWEGRRESQNVEDIRNRGRLPRGTRLGGGLVMVVVLLFVCFLAGPEQALRLLQQVDNQPAVNAPQPAETSAAQDEMVRFVKVVLADTEDVWHEMFAASNATYREPKLKIFQGRVNSGCGPAEAGMGPFYCPADETIYIDLRFYSELKNEFGAPGDFAQAYVIYHEVGHHVQKLLGTSDAVHAQQRLASEKASNELSVRLELQADFLAGVCAHHVERTKRVLEEGDVQEAVRCAQAIGDDAIQRRMRGYVTSDSFTHGTSEQRVRWFLKGLRTGDPNAGNTFTTADL